MQGEEKKQVSLEIVNTPTLATAYSLIFQEVYREIGEVITQRANPSRPSLTNITINDKALDALIQRIPGLFREAGNSRMRVAKVYDFWYEHKVRDSNYPL